MDSIVIVALFIGAALLNVGATGLLLLKRRFIWFVLGLGVSTFMIGVALDAANIAREGDGAGGLTLLAGAILLLIVGFPVTAMLLVAASRPAKPSSWWARRKLDTSYKTAPPPAVPLPDAAHDEA